MTLEEAALRSIERHALVPRGATVICAVSGGADSMAMLTFLHRCRRMLEINLEVAHVHHGLPEALSDEAEACVQAAARSFGLPLHTRRVDVRRFALRTGEGIEAAGRLLRQRWFQRLARRGALVATAHTADDQAETVLMRVIRGSGTQGLRGILPHLGGIIRPFLTVRRVQTRAYVAHHHIAIVDDPTNDDPTYNRRNRVRADLIPMLEHDYNAAVVEALCRLADAARDDTEVLDADTAAILSVDDALRSDGGGIILPLRVAAQPAAVRLRLFRQALRASGAIEPDAETVARLDDLLAGPPGRRTIVTPDIGVRRSGRGLVFGPTAAVETVGEARPLPVPGELRMGGWVIRTRRVSGPGETSPRLDDVANGYRRALHRTWRAAVRDGEELVVRGRIAGDRWRPPRGSGSCKLKATLNAWRVPVEERDAVPIVAQGRQLVCLPGWGVDDRFRPAPDAHDAVQIEITYEEPPCSTTSKRSL